ncbi:unnamed protein product [Vitrella brassicaformis CCMP3155]|uniref:Uncharacterized protein n=1 Tax=Vitrella brassicaformis (strain CCMP3155) TaxID=1169540 RepID=A0A0G4GHI5_VITBC|nr:unnamed protein product [Vitrella brassicaformis CCMP3155]|eukprot:CEM29092.1 unnamed protein product [Vitrella brassicaformis CCMP3155]
MIYICQGCSSCSQCCGSACNSLCQGLSSCLTMCDKPLGWCVFTTFALHIPLFIIAVLGLVDDRSCDRPLKISIGVEALLGLLNCAMSVYLSYRLNKGIKEGARQAAASPAHVASQPTSTNTYKAAMEIIVYDVPFCLYTIGVIGFGFVFSCIGIEWGSNDSECANTTVGWSAVVVGILFLVYVAVTAWLGMFWMLIMEGRHTQIGRSAYCDHSTLHSCVSLPLSVL